MANRKPRPLRRLTPRTRFEIYVSSAGKVSSGNFEANLVLRWERGTSRTELVRSFGHKVTRLLNHFEELEERDLEQKVLKLRLLRRPDKTRPHSIRYIARTLGISQEKVRKILWRPPKWISKAPRYVPPLDDWLARTVEAHDRSRPTQKSVAAPRDDARRGLIARRVTPVKSPSPPSAE